MNIQESSNQLARTAENVALLGVDAAKLKADIQELKALIAVIIDNQHEFARQQSKLREQLNQIQGHLHL